LTLGVALAGMGKLEEALLSYRESLRITPQSAAAHNNLGNALRTLGSLPESVASLEEAIRLLPRYAEAHNNLGITRLQMGDAAAARACYDKALELKPDYNEARLNRALCLLSQGELDHGWREYESRWHGNGMKKRDFAQPEWTGETLPEGKVLLYTEQGLGDTFQFVRYAQLVKERVGSVILECHPNLLNILKRCPGITQLATHGKPLPEFTAHCPLLSLPRIFETRLEAIPTPIPYLFPEPERVRRWQPVLQTIGGFKVGIGWQGNKEFRGDRQRSLALRFFAPFTAIPGVSLIALQKGEGSQQIQEIAGQFLVHTLPGLDEQGGAFVDTAAVMSQLDLVITSDTAVAHLAGALGVPVWVVLSAASDWRWLKVREDCPWYPTMRLLRQKELGDWPELFQRVAQALAVVVKDKTPLPSRVVVPVEALPAAPADLDIVYQSALAHLKQGCWVQSEPLLQDVLRQQPNHAPAQHNLGVALAKLGRYGEAIPLFEKLLRHNPDMVQGHNNLGLAYLDAGQLAKAEPAFRQAVERKPSSWDFHNNLGVALARQGRAEEAVAAYRQALALQPNYGEAHTNLGNVLLSLGRLEEARHHCEQACRLRPDSAEAHNNLGLVHRELGDFPAALACYQQALEREPEHAEARLNRALVWLAQGDFGRGWPEYEWRWRARKVSPRSFSGSRWDGSSLAGRRLLIHTEQGLGDTLQFIRYARMVQERGGRVIVEAPKNLVALLCDCPHIDQLVAQGSPLPAYDVHCPLLSLPGLFQTRLETIPAAVPYLAANQRRIVKWKDRLQSLKGFKVGIAWQGNSEFPGDRQRSVPLEHFAALTRVPGLQLVCLQRGPGTEQMQSLRSSLPLHELPGLDEDRNAFMDTAAAMMLLDLVVTSDTAMAHLAGALGRPVWVVLPFAADWRWLVGRDDCPWYPTMRLFRQDQPGNWPGVMHRLTDAMLERPVAAGFQLAGKKETRSDRQVAQVQPQAEETYKRGLAAINKDQWAEGEACLREVLQLQPERWGAHLNLGVALARQKKVAEAIACFQRYLAAVPTGVEGHNNLGLAHLELGQLPEAEKAFFEATRLQPGNADYYNNLGVCRVRQNKHDDAIDAFQKAVSLVPDKIITLMNLANAFKHKKDFPQAIRCYEQVVRLRPDDADTLCSLGMAYSELGNRAQAAVHYRQAVALKPDFGDARNNLGVALADLNEVAEAEFHLKEAVKIRPEHGETHRNLAIIQLMAGKFQEGWTEYEWRWRCNFPEPHAKTCPRWDGTPLGGRTLLLYPEQGLGDTLQFIRYAALIKQGGGIVVFECPKALVGLLRGQAGVDLLIPQGSRLPKVDVAAPLLSMPFLLGTTLDTVPTRVPYVRAHPERVDRWRQALSHVGGYKVVIAWQGSPKYAGDRQRSIPLKYFGPLAGIDGVQLISLQKGVGTEQLGSAAKELVPLDLGRQIDEDGDAFVDSAAVMQLADLVITSDTALAHLAGALGVPVWLVLHFAGDWRWLRDRDDCPWYPTMRLFRQQTTGDWQGVFERVASALRERLQEQQARHDLAAPHSSGMAPTATPVPSALAVLPVDASSSADWGMPGVHDLEIKAQECRWQTADLLDDPEAARRIGFCRADVAGVPEPSGRPLLPEPADRAAISQQPEPIALTPEPHDRSFSNFETFDVANLGVEEASLLLGPPARVERDCLLGGIGTAAALTAEALLKPALDAVLARWVARQDEASRTGDPDEVDR
jgi:tetratricopeptide (TPR) repeat protein/ADP-heptose:LPS heptosyltransferase